MPYCPKCGKEVSEDAAFCPNCGERLKLVEERAGPRAPEARGGAFGHLSLAFDLAMRKPMVFVPAVLGGIISALLTGIAALWLGPYTWLNWWAYPGSYGTFMSVVVLTVVVSLIGAIISYILFFASLDMSRDAYVDAPLSLGESVSYVLSRIGLFIVASIVGAILSITIILIPVVILMFVVMIVDEAGIGASISRAFSVLGRELSDVLILLAVGIVGSLIVGLIPFIGGLLSTCLNVIIGLAFIDVYHSYKGSS